MIFMNRQFASMCRMSCVSARPGEWTAVRSGQLDVGEGHVIHWEAAGAPDGIPALVLHGGPGSASSPSLRQFFDPARYRVISFDQRGCGLSSPRGATVHNDTGRLVCDIERLRMHLGCSGWLVVGGSWGATLALTYAARHPAAVHALLLRNLFVPGKNELQWFFQDAAALHPVAWGALAGLAPLAERNALLPWLASVFADNDAVLQASAAVAWLGWERALAGAPAPQGRNLHDAIDRFRIQAHYLLHGCWVAPAEWLGLAGWPAPVLFLHGQRDAVCRPAAAWEVHQSLPGSRFAAVDAGHDPFVPSMAEAMRRALDAFAGSGHPAGGFAA
jgi:proline iminopeptidase